MKKYYVLVGGVEVGFVRARTRKAAEMRALAVFGQEAVVVWTKQTRE